MWSRQVGTEANDFTSAVTVDSNGAIYIAGRTQGAFPGKTALGGGNDAFLIKYYADGTVLWTQQLGTSRFDSGDALGIGGEDVLYILGDTRGSFPDLENVGGFDAYLGRYDSDGDEIWTRQFATTTDDLASGIAVDNRGDVYVVGRTLGVFPGERGQIAEDAFIQKYDGEGNVVWSRQMATSGFDEAVAVAVDGEFNAFMVGSTSGRIPDQTKAGMGSEIFVVRYDDVGDLMWARQFGTHADDFATDAAIDLQGNLYVIGSVGGSLPGQAGLGGRDDGFLRLYDPDGNELWTLQFGTLFSESTAGIQVADGYVYLAGTTDGGIFDQANLGKKDAFLMKIQVPR